MPSALFVVSIYNYHREVEPVISTFVNENWQIDVLLGWQDQDAIDAAAIYEKKGARVIWAPSSMSYGTGFPSKGQASASALDIQKGDLSNGSMVKQSLKKYLRKTQLGCCITDVLYNIKKIKKVKKFASQIFKQKKYDAVFQGPFHSVGKLDNAIYCLVKTNAIKHYCYPVSAYHGRRNTIMARKGNISIGMLSKDLNYGSNYINKTIALFFPGWLASFENEKFYLAPPTLMLAAHLQNIPLDDIWAKPQPGFSRIFVFSNFSKSLLEDGLFPMGKVYVCGVPLLDGSISRLDDQNEVDKMFHHIGMQKRGTFLLVNIEPSFEHHYCDEDLHWERFNKLMEIVSKTGFQVVLSLHPLCELKNYEYAIAKYKIHISSQYKIHDLYPLCRCVISFACSTNIFAEIFAKKLFIYDFYDLTRENSPRAKEFRLSNATFCYNFYELDKQLSKLDKNDESYQIPFETYKKATADIIKIIHDDMGIDNQ